jgi:signal transduction histidine kinase
MRTSVFLTIVLLAINIPLFSQTDFNIFSKANGKIDIELQKTKADRFYNQGIIDSALNCYALIYSIASETNDSINLCYSLKEQGSMCDILGNYSKALEYLLKASEIANENSYFQLSAATDINIGIVYFNLKKADKSILYCNSALKTGETISDTIIMIKALNNLGNAYLTLLGDMKNAEKCFNKSVELARLMGFEQAVTVGLNNLCQIYMNSGREFEAKTITENLLNQYPSNPFVYYNIGNLYRQNKNNLQAKEAFIKALSLSVVETELQMVLLNDLSEIEKESNNFEAALDYYKSFISLQDSIHSVEQNRSIAELETKYKLLEKEKTITELQAKTLRNERTTTIIVAAFVTAVLILLVILIYFTLKRRISVQKIKSLEDEKRIIAFTASLKGEEKERARLSSELHDGLGGILSAVKLNIESEDTLEAKEKSLGLITQSISEMRRISNALLPETLLKFGMKTAVKSFCSSFNAQSGKVKIEFSFFGKEYRYSSHFELTVYRIVQEIINNSVKHSGASEITVQIISDESRLFIGINDNGKGFDISSPQIKRGLGLDNIKERSSIYGGRVELNSTPGNGTEVVIEFENLKDNKTIYDTNINS